MKTLNSTTKTTKTSYSTPSIKVIEIDNDALMLNEISGGDMGSGGDLSRERRQSAYWDYTEDEVEE